MFAGLPGLPIQPLYLIFYPNGVCGYIMQIIGQAFVHLQQCRVPTWLRCVS